MSPTTTPPARRREQRPRARLDVAYGDGPDDRLDLFFPDPAFLTRPAPVHLFIHGGYWRANSKDNFSFVADSIVGLGAIAAVIDYSLMPGARMATLVDQARRAANWLGRQAGEFGGDPHAISASGHSAGGHLVSYLVIRGPREAEFPRQRRPLDSRGQRTVRSRADRAKLPSAGNSY